MGTFFDFTPVFGRFQARPWNIEHLTTTVRTALNAPERTSTPTAGSHCVLDDMIGPCHHLQRRAFVAPLRTRRPFTFRSNLPGRALQAIARRRLMTIMTVLLEVSLKCGDAFLLLLNALFQQ